jgi:hypothetical protein
MLGFHQNGPQAGHGRLGIEFGGGLPGILWKKAQGELCEREVEVALRGLVEDALSEP